MELIDKDNYFSSKTRYMITLSPSAEDILLLFQKHGHIVYGEVMSVLSHSVQAGEHARAQGLDEELILSAFLHDIGHLVPLEQAANYERMGEFGMEAHDKWGEQYLVAAGFSPRLVAVVRNHVDAKRYLCATDQQYYDQLSEASKETLQYQGGPFSEEEAAQFAAGTYFKESIQLRRIDELAKEEGFVVSENHMVYYANLLKKFID